MPSYLRNASFWLNANIYLHKVLAAGEESGCEPHELPASLLGQAVAVLRELPHDLAVDLVTQNLLSITIIRCLEK